MSEDMETSAQLIRIRRGDGEDFDIAGAKLTWKVKSDVTDTLFCFFEQVLAPGDGVPLHTHSYTETFYVLSGAVTFAGAGRGDPMQGRRRRRGAVGDAAWLRQSRAGRGADAQHQRAGASAVLRCRRRL